MVVVEKNDDDEGKQERRRRRFFYVNVIRCDDGGCEEPQADAPCGHSMMEHASARDFA